jgi:hypothetical protein
VRTRRLDSTYSRDILDKMVSLANKYARREITRLRGRLERNAEEGRELLAKYSDMYGGKYDLPHEIEDFLQGLGE